MQDNDTINILIHEIKNPLTVIKGYCDLIEDKNISDIISFQSDYINYILNNISVFNKLTKNIPFAIATQDIKLKEITDNIINVFKDKYNKIQFENEIDHNIIIESDKNLLSIVLYNIIENACKYTNEGIVNISYNNKICIKDNGCGIKEEDINKITDLYFRSNTEALGTGVGLYLVKKICDKIDFYLTIESKLHKGTKIYLSKKQIL